VTKLFKLSA